MIPHFEMIKRSHQSKNYSQILTDRKHNQKVMSKIIKIEQYKVAQTLKIYNWRFSTQFPIPKVVSWTILGDKIQKNKDQNLVSINVKYLQFTQRLSDFQNVPLFKMLYVIRQSIIDFQRLCSMFHYFQITARNIIFDSNNKCRVWITDKIQSNVAVQRQINQTQFVKNLCQICQQKATKSKSSIQFFHGSQNQKSFYQLYKYVEVFTKLNKLTIPSNFIMKFQAIPSSCKLTRCPQNNKIFFCQINKAKVNNIKIEPSQKVQIKIQSSQIERSIGSKMNFSTGSQMKISGNIAQTLQQYSQCSIFNKNNQICFQFFQQKISSKYQSEIIKKQTNTRKQVWKSHYEKIKPKIKAVRKFSHFQKIDCAILFAEQNNKKKENQRNSFCYNPQLTQSILFSEIINKQYQKQKQQEQIQLNKRQQVSKKNGWNLKLGDLFYDCRNLKASFYQKGKSPRMQQTWLYQRLKPQFIKAVTEHYLWDCVTYGNMTL